MHAFSAAAFNALWIVILCTALANRDANDGSVRISTGVPVRTWTSNWNSNWTKTENAAAKHDHHFRMSTTPLVAKAHDLNLLTLTVSIVVLAALSQTILALATQLGLKEAYETQVKNGVNLFRWCTAAVVGPLRYVLIAALIGITDLRLQLLLGGVAVLLAAFGALGEIMTYIENNYHYESPDHKKTDAENQVRKPLRLSLKYGATQPVGAMSFKHTGNEGELLTDKEKTALKCLPQGMSWLCFAVAWYALIHTAYLSYDFKTSFMPAYVWRIVLVQCAIDGTRLILNAVRAFNTKIAKFEYHEFIYCALFFAAVVALSVELAVGLLSEKEIGNLVWVSANASSVDGSAIA